MDVVSPDLVWIDGSCYRINCVDSQVETDNNIYEDDNNYEEADDTDEFIFTTNANGRVKTSFHVPQFFYGHIIGTKGAVKKRIENETKTEVKLPPRGHNGDIIITGPNNMTVAAAARRIKMIVMATRQKQRPNHFLSIPMTDQSITNSVKSFKDDILSEDEIPAGVEESIFIRPERLHLTILVMFLADKEEILTATRLLEEAKIDVVDPLFGNKGSLNVSVSGVSYMNDEPSAVKVLYSEIAETEIENLGQLHDLVQKLNDFFNKSGFKVGSHNGNKLHVTLMNVKKRTSEDDKKTFKPFDASSILKKYEKNVFGQQKISHIYLSQMNNEDLNSYYPTAAKITL